MGCGESLVKYILFFVNLFFALAGLALLGIGIAFELQISAITNLLEGNYQAAPISSMVVGGIVFLIAFFGCCGAIRENSCMLTTYAIFVILLMVVKVALGTVIFVKLDDFVQDTPRWLNELFNQDKNSFGEIERTFQCCGTVGAAAYGFSNIPATCCATPPCNLINSYSGCNTVLSDFFRTSGLTIGVFAICIAAIELVAVVFALCLANHVRNKERRSRY